jgi:hypothetical protein
MASWVVHDPCFVHLQIVQCKQEWRGVHQNTKPMMMTQGNTQRPG